MSETSEQENAPPTPPPAKWITRAETVVVLALALAFLGAVTAVVIQQRRAGEGVEVIRGQRDDFTYRVSVNRAINSRTSARGAVSEVVVTNHYIQNRRP